MKTLITQYLASKEGLWALTTMEKERHKLNSMAQAFASWQPEDLWRSLADRAPYTRVTMWSRATDFASWLIEEGHKSGPNPYKAFRKKWARKFQGQYVPRLPEISFQEAQARIQQIPKADIRAYALCLLNGALRASEAARVVGGRVQGKGGRVREVFIESAPTPVAYHTLRRALAGVGLTPHMLRKITLTELANCGASPFELMKIAGWSSVQTATSYVQASQSRLSGLMNQVQHGGTNSDSTEVQVPPIL